MLATTDLTWGVGGFTILSDITFSAGEGEFVSVIGPNGAGKTSFLNVLSGINVARRGRVELDGRDITALRPADRVRLGLGRTFQTSSLFTMLTVLENARLAAQSHLGGSASLWTRPRARDEATAMAIDAVSAVGLADRAGTVVADLSHGDKRKLELALLACGRPRVVLLDEPTAGVSVEEVAPLMAVVSDMHAAGRTVVMVEHRMEVVMEISDRIVVLHNGRVLTQGTPDEVMADERVQSAYTGAAA